MRKQNNKDIAKEVRMYNLVSIKGDQPNTIHTPFGISLLPCLAFRTSFIIVQHFGGFIFVCVCMCATFRPPQQPIYYHAIGPRPLWRRTSSYKGKDMKLFTFKKNNSRKLFLLSWAKVLGTPNRIVPSDKTFLESTRVHVI